MQPLFIYATKQNHQYKHYILFNVATCDHGSLFAYMWNSPEVKHLHGVMTDEQVWLK